MGLFQRDLIPRLCKESGRWMVVSKEASDYRVRNNDGRRPVNITITQRPGVSTAMFQAFFPVRFSLEREPKGLFGRILLRNFEMKHGAAWSMYIGQSAEACLTLVAKVPIAALDAGRLNVTCDEIVNEMNAFQQELHDKYRYEAGLPAGSYGNGLPSVAEPYFEPERQTTLVQPPKRYQLPR